ncbi:unnamed protein product [Ectocarpus sp. 12 AP-2014]
MPRPPMIVLGAYLLLVEPVQVSMLPELEEAAVGGRGSSSRATTPCKKKIGSVFLICLKFGGMKGSSGCVRAWPRSMAVRIVLNMHPCFAGVVGVREIYMSVCGSIGSIVYSATKNRTWTMQLSARSLHPPTTAQMKVGLRVLSRYVDCRAYVRYWQGWRGAGREKTHADGLIEHPDRRSTRELG